ncbi:adenylyl-sulfate kinase [Pseudodesulfovibrio nedwellii]|uniref:Adenylyl-sulfate kinase n=1 Tax=Pseudodesulfovibrio nedwellii TaxID=2973072 RepID=A0ABN6S8G9_9BACT|nr:MULTISPECIES: adenylyl-sulfate kinase [Pseudodesulfovibrio]BDQ38493.1 adenylyl-sulfate kinase [Pseudodesulfovibrio nedwellii]
MPENKYKCKFRGEVCRGHREMRNGYRAMTLWFCGLSGAGKSTIAHAVEKRLFDEGARTYTFDGDNVRHGLCGDLSFSPEGRAENIRRISEMTKLFMDAGTICLCAFITPEHNSQQRLRGMHEDGDFFLVHVDCPVEVCEERDVKGYYKLAREGKIKNYTGISAPFDTPESPDLRLDTTSCNIDECVDQVFAFLKEKISLLDVK